MKKILFYLIIITFGFIYSCKNPQRSVLNVYSMEDLYRSSNEHYQVIKASIVDGFLHQYDSTRLVITNKETDVQIIKNGKTPTFENISLSPGLYSIYMDTPDPLPVSYYINFAAYDTSVTVNPGVNNIILENGQTKQACILVKKDAVFGAPVIQIENGIYLMSEYNDYYYAYVDDQFTPSLRYRVVEGGELSFMPIKIVRKTIYLIETIASGSIGVQDMFPNLQRS